MDAQSELRTVFNAAAVFVELGPNPNLFALETVVANLRIVEVQRVLKDKLLVPKLNHHWLVGVFDVKNDRFVPNRGHPEALVGLRIGVVLEDLDQVDLVLQVLSVHDVHFQLAVTPNAHLGDELTLSSHRLLQLELYFLHLAVVVYDIAHHFFLALRKLVPSVHILPDELLAKHLQNQL